MNILKEELPIVNSNIKKLIDTRYKGKVTGFSKAIGLPSHQTVSRLFTIDQRNGKYPSPSTQIIKAIVDKIPGVTFEWLTGNLEDNTIEEKKDFTITQVTFDSYMEVKYLPVIAQAGYLNGFYDIKENIEQLDTMLIPREFEKGNYLVVEISGDSMNDGTTRAICDGDRLLLKELDKSAWKDKLHFRQNLFVIMSNEGIVCKQIVDHNTETHDLTCHSWNNHYPDYKVNLGDVYKLFYVKKIVERRIKF